jgi:hypothetical protein
MAKVETRGDVRTDMSPCWTHSMSKSSSGYGQIMFSGIAYGSHVFSYLIHNGFPEIPKGYDVSHNCDNKNCVNPDHLSLETHKQNTIDAVERIRIAKPIKISTVNLEPCYNCIKAHRACEGGGAECLRCMEEKLECVYKEYKVTPGAFKLGECSGENNKNAKLNWVKVREIRAKISAGIPYGGLKKLALEYNVSYILMQKIKSNVNWKIEDDPGI